MNDEQQAKIKRIEELMTYNVWTRGDDVLFEVDGECQAFFLGPGSLDAALEHAEESARTLKGDKHD